MNQQANADERGRFFNLKERFRLEKRYYLSFLSAFVCINLCLISSCSKPPPTDLRTFLPAETLVYLESGDLSETLKALTENRAYRELAAGEADFSALENVQAAIAVGGFETSEQQVTGEQAILDFKPQFVLVADTHRGESTAASVAENLIGKFTARTTGGNAKPEKSERRGAQFFAWTGADGRKFFAAVAGGVIYAGNDENLLDKCLAVRAGEAENLLKNENLNAARESARADENLIAFGYASPEAVARFADVAGVTFALRAGESEAARSFVARNLPQILQKTAREIVWTARKTGAGIEDKFSIKTAPEVSQVWRETLVPAGGGEFAGARFVPQNFETMTRYDLQNPQIAWRSVLLVVSRQIETRDAQILAQFSGLLFQPYGVRDAETFLSAAGSEIVTVRFDETGEKSVVITAAKDSEKLKSSLAGEMNFKAAPEKIGSAEIWRSPDGNLAAAFAGEFLILGENISVRECLQAAETGQNFAKTVQFNQFMQNKTTSVTIAKDAETARSVVRFLGTPQDENRRFVGFYQTATRFTAPGVERRTVSDFGLIGTILEQISE